MSSQSRGFGTNTGGLRPPCGRSAKGRSSNGTLRSAHTDTRTPASIRCRSNSTTRGTTRTSPFAPARHVVGLDLCLAGDLKWENGNPSEVDAAVRIGDRLVLIECFSYELPLDFEVGKPSVFDKRKEFVLEKVDQARTLAERIAKEPKGSKFDIIWAKSIEWRVVSPFVEFAWQIDEPLYDEAGLTRRDCHVFFRSTNCWTTSRTERCRPNHRSRLSRKCEN
jgi:hypothetical protein